MSKSKKLQRGVISSSIRKQMKKSGVWGTQKIIDALAEQGIEVTKQQVYSVRCQDKRAQDALAKKQVKEICSATAAIATLVPRKDTPATRYMKERNRRDKIVADAAIAKIIKKHGCTITKYPSGVSLSDEPAAASELPLWFSIDEIRATKEFLYKVGGAERGGQLVEAFTLLP